MLHIQHQIYQIQDYQVLIIEIPLKKNGWIKSISKVFKSGRSKLPVTHLDLRPLNQPNSTFLSLHLPALAAAAKIVSPISFIFPDLILFQCS